MDYKLVMELRDAGFTILTPRTLGLPENTIVYGRSFVGDPDGNTLMDDALLIPTLEELIEACVKLSPDGDFHLEHLQQGEGEEWGAATCWLPIEKSEWYCGSTPVEAVARLWLALNKVDNPSK